MNHGTWPFPITLCDKTSFITYHNWVNVNSCWLNNTIWWQRSGSTLAQVMAWCHQNHCWLLIKGVWHSHESNFTKKCSWVESRVRTWWVWSVHHYSDVMMSMMASQITSITIVCSTVCSNQHPPVISGFPSQRASNVENVSNWWCHDGSKLLPLQGPVLLLQPDAVARVLANGSAAFFESCATIGWKDCDSVRSL